MNNNNSLFVYGTLLDPLVQATVFGRIIKGLPDTLAGYEVTSMRFASGIYPAIVKDDESVTSGRVLSISGDEMRSADLYEGEEYTRVEVVLKSGLTAWVYVPVI